MVRVDCGGLARWAVKACAPLPIPPHAGEGGDGFARWCVWTVAAWRGVPCKRTLGAFYPS